MIYYVSNSGNDANTGTSRNTPFLTLNKLNTVLKKGDSVYLREGDTFFGKIDLPNNGTTEYSFIESYGNGAKPVISGFKTIKNTSWIQHSAKVWKVSLVDNTKFTGDVFNLNTNVGFIKVNGMIHGDKKNSLALLLSQWQFYSDNTYLYIYADTNPSTAFENTVIEVCCNTHLVNLWNNASVHNLSIIGTGAHGINGANNNKIIGVDIDEIGGSYLIGYANNEVRYGNGIQFWVGAKDAEIRNCSIKSVYDAAFTCQGPMTSNFENFLIEGNRIENCNQSFEFWAKGGNFGFKNVLVKNNTCIGAGYGWAQDVRPDKDVAVHLLFYQFEVNNSDIRFENNIFYKAKSGLYYSHVGDLPNVFSQNNTIILDADQNIKSLSNDFKVEHYQSFVNSRRLEKGSKFFINKLSDNPISESVIKLQNLVSFLIADNKNIHKSLGKALGKASHASDFWANQIDCENPVFVKKEQYTSKLVEVADSTKYAKIATFKLSQEYKRVDCVIDYTLWGDSINPRGGVGSLNVQIVPNVGFTSVGVELSVFEIFKFQYLFSPTDFVVVVEKISDNECICSLLFNIGKKVWVKLSYKPRFVLTDSTTKNTVIFYDNQDLVDLPAGNVITGNSQQTQKEGSTILVAGQKVVNLNLMRSTSKPVLTVSNLSGTFNLTRFYKATSGIGTLTISAIKDDGSINTGDTSVINYFIP